MPEPLRFPAGFLWGTATAAHQVEGWNTNSWSDWEQQPGRIFNGDRSGAACGWWRDAEGDFERMAELGCTLHRMSVEWSRIEPEEGLFDEGALARYRELLQGLRRRGIEPMVTLHHFTNPRWLEARGGWLYAATPQLFARYAERVVGALGDLCQLWCTLNEPTVYIANGFVRGVWPPGRTRPADVPRVLSAMLRGHALAAAAIRRAGPGGQIGVAHHLRPFDPASPRLNDMLGARWLDYIFNEMTLRALDTGLLAPPVGVWERVPGLARSCDFVGVNYYTRELVAADSRVPGELFVRHFIAPGRPHSDITVEGTPFGEIYPNGLERVLRRVARYRLPIYITELGVPDQDDDIRPRFMLGHLAALRRAMDAGADVRGLCWWTLVDNFEWAEGWGLRFGLYALDERTGERRPRRSAGLFAAIAHANAIPAGEPHEII
jgi:beta-glucosidase